MWYTGFLQDLVEREEYTYGKFRPGLQQVKK